MRLFFAANLPQDALDKVAEARNTVRAVLGDDGIKWVRPEQFHYTLKFLGELSPRRAYQAVEGTQVVARAIRPFDLTLGGVGAFPNTQRASVVWVGATAGAEPLCDLAGILDRTLAGRGFHRERQPLKPHLTIARVKGYGGETSVARNLASIVVPDITTFTLDHIDLMQSVLRPEGPTYTVVETFPLRQE